MRPYYFLGNNWGLTRLTNGLPFFVNTADRGISPWIIMGGTWENFVDDVLCSLAKTGDVFLDIGANMGYYTVKVGDLVGNSGKVFSFECNPELYPFLIENININGFNDRALAFQVAAGAMPGKSTLHFTYNSMGGGAVAPPETQPQPGGIEVEIARIDDLLPSGITCDVVKVDVEGFEPLVFKGMEQLLSRSPQAAIVTEFNIQGWNRFGNAWEILENMRVNRDLFQIHTDGRLVERQVAALKDSVDERYVAYVLLLPRDSHLRKRISRFIAA